MRVCGRHCDSSNAGQDWDRRVSRLPPLGQQPVETCRNLSTARYGHRGRPEVGRHRERGLGRRLRLTSRCCSRLAEKRLDRRGTDAVACVQALTPAACSSGARSAGTRRPAVRCAGPLDSPAEALWAPAYRRVLDALSRRRCR